MKMMFEYECTNQECCAFNEVVEELVDTSLKDQQQCSQCQQPLSRVASAVASWSPSKERTRAQIKEKNRQQMVDCVKKDMHPDEIRSGKGDAVWRNKQRKKNKRRDTIASLGDAYKTWEPTPSITDPK